MSTSILPAARRPPVVSKGWVQLAALVSLSGFFVLVLMGFLTYQSSPPTPQRVVSASGQTVFTGADIRAGQDVFLRNGLMENGSIFGHGAYLGPDFTADYLHRSGSPWGVTGCRPEVRHGPFVAGLSSRSPSGYRRRDRGALSARSYGVSRTPAAPRSPSGAPAGALRAAMTSLACIDGHE